MNEFLKNLITQAITLVLFSLIVFFIQKYFQDRSAPRLAQEILKKQNFITDKKEAFSQGIDLAIQYVQAKYSAQYSNTFGEAPTHSQMNSVMLKLYIYSDDQNIPKQFRKLLLPLKEGEDIILELTNFLNMIAKELGNENAKIDFREFQLIYPSKSGTLNP